MGTYLSGFNILWNACCGHIGALVSPSANQTLSPLQQQQRFQMMSNQSTLCTSSSQNHRRNYKLEKMVS
jgi:hypothetical protein